jgi:hypothetical protein
MQTMNPQIELDGRSFCCSVWNAPHLSTVSGHEQWTPVLGLCRGILVVGIPDAHVLSLHVHTYKGQGRFAHDRTLLLPTATPNSPCRGMWALNGTGDIVWVSRKMRRLFVISAKGKIKVQRSILLAQGGIHDVRWSAGSVAIFIDCDTVLVFSDTGFPLFAAVLRDCSNFFWHNYCLRPGRLIAVVRRQNSTSITIQWSEDERGELQIRTVWGGMLPDSVPEAMGAIVYNPVYNPRKYQDVNFQGVYWIVHSDRCPCVVLSRFSTNLAVRRVTGLGLWATNDDDRRMLCMSAMRTCWLASCA